jgi:hypothetical protein
VEESEFTPVIVCDAGPLIHWERRGETSSMEQCLRFVPSRVDGIFDVTEVAIYPDRLELKSAGRCVAFRFWEIARWPSPCWFWRLVARFGWRPRWLPVGDRDWFHAAPDRFFAFYTSPPVVVYMPDESGVEYGQTTFRRIQDVIARGGFGTFDLG